MEGNGQSVAVTEGYLEIYFYTNMFYYYEYMFIVLGLCDLYFTFPTTICLKSTHLSNFIQRCIYETCICICVLYCTVINFAALRNFQFYTKMYLRYKLYSQFGNHICCCQ